MRTCGVFAFVLLSASLCCGAETNITAVATVKDRGVEWFPFGGIKYDSVTGPTVAGCACFNFRSPFARPHRVGSSDVYTCSHAFVFPQIEVGADGGKLQIGLGEGYFAGWNFRVSMLRTWGEPSRVEPNQIYLGVEFQVNFFLLNGTVGVYSHVRGNDDDHGVIATWSTGLGF